MTQAAPLHGVRVVELATMVAVPAATQILASYGAEVIKVEDTVAGDPLRFYGSMKGGLSGWYAVVNAGKRAIAIDLKSKDGRAVLDKLLEGADVFIDGFRPGAVDRLGFGYEQLKDKYPKLICVSASGYGKEGPYADRPVYDPLIQAGSGWAAAQDVDGKPTLVSAMAADKVGAYNNAQAIMAALIQRGSSGHGCHVETNMLDANVAFVWPDVMMHCTLQDEDADHRPNLLDSYRLYAASDGWVSVAAGTDGQWRGFCEALDREDLGADERFATSAMRGANITDWYDAMEDAMSRFSVSEVVDRLVAAEVPVAAVVNPEDVYDDEHVRATSTVQESVHPIAGRFRHPRSRAAQFGVDLSLAPAPSHGEHSQVILAELGYGEREVEQLRESSTIR